MASTQLKPKSLSLLQEQQPDTFINDCAMQLAIVLEPALVSRSPAPIRLLSKVMQRMVR